jgi:perosamine synthetase
MTNICAAIGCAQLERAQDFLQKKKQLARWYEEALQDLPLVTHHAIGEVIHSYWMCSILLDDPIHREPLRKALSEQGIETRPFFYPAHLLPMYAKPTADNHPVAESLGSRGINLPSWPGLTLSQITEIANQIREYFKSVRGI